MSGPIQAGSRTCVAAVAILALSHPGCTRPRPDAEPPPAADASVAAEPASEPPSPDSEAEPEADVAPEADAEIEADAGPAQRGGPKGLPRLELCAGSEEAGPVDFRHKKHWKQFACKKCHHEIEADQRPAPCSSCHGADPGILGLQQAYHKTCVPCHASLGLGPAKCMECHAWIKKKEGKP
jgi:hypothetical protein